MGRGNFWCYIYSHSLRAFSFQVVVNIVPYLKYKYIQFLRIGQDLISLPVQISCKGNLHPTAVQIINQNQRVYRHHLKKVRSLWRKVQMSPEVREILSTSIAYFAADDVQL